MRQPWAGVLFRPKPRREEGAFGDLRKVIANERARYSGWPPWPTAGGTGIPIVSQGDGIESWLGQKDPDVRTPARADFWRASPRGLCFQLRGYEEDGKELGPDQPGQVLHVFVPIWRIAECLLHAQDMANRLADERAKILFLTTWTGLGGRWLRSSGLFFDSRQWNADEDSVTLETIVESKYVRENLAEIVWRLLRPLYEKFQFFELPRDAVQQEIESMLQRQR